MQKMLLKTWKKCKGKHKNCRKIGSKSTPFTLAHVKAHEKSVATNALGYLLEVARVQGKNGGIFFPIGNQLLNVCFVNDSTLMVELT